MIITKTNRAFPSNAFHFSSSLIGMANCLRRVFPQLTQLPTKSVSPVSFIGRKLFSSSLEDQQKKEFEEEKETLEKTTDSIGDETNTEVNEEGEFVNNNTGEIGGPRGPEPTRYGDWERKGRCSDFWFLYYLGMNNRLVFLVLLRPPNGKLQKIDHSIVHSCLYTIIYNIYIWEIGDQMFCLC